MLVRYRNISFKKILGEKLTAYEKKYFDFFVNFEEILDNLIIKKENDFSIQFIIIGDDIPKFEYDVVYKILYYPEYFFEGYNDYDNINYRDLENYIKIRFSKKFKFKIDQLHMV